MIASAVVVGAGLTGAAATWCLVQSGYSVRVYEREFVVAGHIRTEWIGGIPYEPHGAHIFHTADDQLWRLASSHTHFEPYRHRVLIRVRDHLLSWPLQVSEIVSLDGSEEVMRQLSGRPAEPDETNFETYCVSILGHTLYEECIRFYTLKQWGQDPSTLSVEVARGRIELRTDDYRPLFRDPYQGWPRNGYGDLVEALLSKGELQLGTPIAIGDVPSIADPGTPVIVTSALDDFFDEPEALPWRGVRLEPTVMRNVRLAQEAMVVNEPGRDIPWTRTIETKWAVPDLHAQDGTVVMREFPNAPAKHYPVLDARGQNISQQRKLEYRLAAYRRNPLLAAGRLATYRYINMDAAIRSGIQAAERVLGSNR